MVMLKAVPAVCGLLIVLNVKWLIAPVLTVNVLLVPDTPPPDVDIEMLVPAVVSVTEPVQTPAANVPVVAVLMVPVDTVKVFVPV